MIYQALERGVLLSQQKEVAARQQMRARVLKHFFNGNRAAYDEHVASFPSDPGPARDLQETLWLRSVSSNLPNSR
jgi:hypothetical protein